MLINLRAWRIKVFFFSLGLQSFKIMFTSLTALSTVTTFTTTHSSLGSSAIVAPRIARLILTEWIRAWSTAGGPPNYITCSPLASSRSAALVTATPMRPAAHHTICNWAASPTTPPPTLSLIRNNKQENQKEPKRSCWHYFDKTVGKINTSKPWN